MASDEKRDILLLLDYKGEFFGRHKRVSETTHLAKLTTRLAAHGLSLRAQRFSDVDFRATDYRDKWVLYQSAQDPGLLYRSYIEDIVLGLQLAGARLIPPFPLLRAHHNKVFMEVLRDLTPLDALKSLRSRYYGSYEELHADLDRISYPAVLKLSEGDSSKGVRLLEDAEQARRVVRKLTWTFDLEDAWNNVRRALVAPEIKPASLHRRKFIVQSFVPGLDHDWKVLLFADKCFVARRAAGHRDFRASGTRQPLCFPRELPAGLLEFAHRIYRAFDAPYASLDIMHDGETFYLGEMQFLRFGSTVLLRSPHHFQLRDGTWQRIEGPSEWEGELARAIAAHLQGRA